MKNYKRIIKISLIILGVILLVINFLNYFIDSGDFFYSLFNITLSAIVEFGENESILSILGITFTCVGLLIKNDYNLEEYKISKKSVKYYKVLKFIGFMPFIGVLCFGIFSAINGFSFFFSTSYGVEAFLESIFWISIMFLWPFYLIGIVIIIKSTSKIKELQKYKNQNIKVE